MWYLADHRKLSEFWVGRDSPFSHPGARCAPNSVSPFARSTRLLLTAKKYFFLLVKVAVAYKLSRILSAFAPRSKVYVLSVKLNFPRLWLLLLVKLCMNAKHDEFNWGEFVVWKHNVLDKVWNTPTFPVCSIDPCLPERKTRCLSSHWQFCLIHVFFFRVMDKFYSAVSQAC